MDLPLDYKKGFKNFLNVKIELSKKPFIPREETEFWVEAAIRELKKEKKKTHCLDLFSGSGCVGIAILKNIKNSYCDFADVNRKTLEQIKINLEINNIENKRARLIKTDIFSNIKRKYDYILANPPYVAKERLPELELQVKLYEPKIAWYGRQQGMFYIEKFLKKAKSFLRKNGKIFFEFDPEQKHKIGEIFKREGYKKFKFFKDQFKKWRFAKIEY
ncbi:MAG: hypothetical protein CO144_01540 [Candidatus Nealsonbacteria bacterium CG_4_9_14_3_um_filter_35_11]|nr:MAG: hypothetical protein COX88_00310 [Candidatus Nealsonbacteria bacterium CG_4_10_14_0_2_um_filter_35_20]PJA84484.1 MAG: hypothetical protein CO144_01540 [Candidatus Nealsonbacteria bacterium CG_4_9_14_3_um_filter_35_11]